LSLLPTTEEHLKRYTAAILLASCAIAVAALARPMFDGRVPQAVFSVAVVAAAAYGGLGPGLVVTAISTTAIGWLFRGAVVSLLGMRPGLISFAALGIVISFVLDQFRQSRAALERSKQQLQSANDELSRRSQALALSNEELRRFAYALSHDLQNPLRTVSVFTEHFARTYTGPIDEPSAQSLRFIVQGVDRMQQMIRGLLDYSTAMNDPRGLNEISDGNTAIAAALDDLRGLIDQTGARITSDSLPAVAARSEPIRQLLANLISNAIKYRDHSTPEIHIAAKPNGSEWIFSVRDNGIGIDMQYAEKIFGVFERLHGSDRYGGSGIGLAICRAIVQRYGGRIWVESELGRGSTFSVTLPVTVERQVAAP
jgi:light-regulated signal transduction histidine kinase (bacteriophytochrome)